MVKPEIIRKRLNKLDEYLAILYSLQRYSFDDFVENPEHYGSAERFLHLAIETITDLGNHVIADDGLGVVNWHSDIPIILAEKGYIGSELKERWIRMIGFRNVLVHEYIDIDRRTVFEVLHRHLGDIEAVKHVFAKYL